jgi:hypothetical protein
MQPTSAIDAHGSRDNSQAAIGGIRPIEIGGADQYRQGDRQAADSRHPMRMHFLHPAEIGIQRGAVQSDRLNEKQSQQGRRNEAQRERIHITSCMQSRAQVPTATLSGCCR